MKKDQTWKEWWVEMGKFTIVIFAIIGLTYTLWTALPRGSMNDTVRAHFTETCGDVPARYRITGQGTQAIYVEASMNEACEETSQIHTWVVK